MCRGHRSQSEEGRAVNTPHLLGAVPRLGVLRDGGDDDGEAAEDRAVVRAIQAAHVDGADDDKRHLVQEERNQRLQRKTADRSRVDLVDAQRAVGAGIRQ